MELVWLFVAVVLVGGGLIAVAAGFSELSLDGL